MVRKQSQKNKKTFYISDDFIALFNKLEELLKKDKDYLILRKSKTGNLFSIWVREQANKYVGEKLAEQGMEPQLSEVEED